jgi:hypothetical protein
MPCKRPCNSVGAGGGTEQGHGGDTAFGGVGLSRAGDNFSAGSSSSLDIFSGYMRIEFLDPRRSIFATPPV